MSNATDIRRAILRYLARRDYSCQELLLRLKQKGFSEAEIQPVIAALSAGKLISDQRFAEQYARNRRSKGYGPLRISMELKNRGISAETIAEVLEMPDNSWLDDVQRVWRKHFKGRIPTDFATRAKQQRFLQYRGFTREQIESVLRDYNDRSPD